MTPCISQVTTLSTPFEADIPAFARSGWSAVEIWLTKLETYLFSHSIGDARALLDGEGIVPAGASGQGGLLLARGAEREAHWSGFRRRLEVLGALGVPTLVLAADHAREAVAADYARAVDSLGEAAELAGRSGVRLALECQAATRFCASLDTAAALTAQVGSPSLGLCLDLFHYYTGPSKFEDLAYLTPETLFWFQVSDVSGLPRELAGDSDRVLPGDGDFQVGPILEHLGRIGYEGAVSVEVLNPLLWPIPAEQLAGVAHRALVRLLDAGANTSAGRLGGP